MTAPTRPARRPGHRRTLAALALVAALLAPALAAGAATPRPPDADRRAATGAAWLADQVTPGGYIEGFGGTPDPGNTLQTALALAAAGTEGEVFARVVAYLAADPLAAVDGGGGVISPGSLGILLLVVDAAGADPTSFGGQDLVALLEGTLGLHTAGLYGAGDPSFDGAFRQSLALLGLLAAGIDPPAVAEDWLVDQQCDGATPAAEGGWEPFRANTGVPCTVPDPVTFTGPDTNSTALAVQALAALGRAPAHDAAAFLASAQAEDGGFPFLTGLDPDPNSTALVIQALVATGGPAAVSGFAGPGGDPLGALLAWQLPCGAPEAGAFASPFTDGAPDQFATQQAVWGAALVAFPLGPVAFADAGDPCADPPPTSTPPTSGPSAAPVVAPSTATPATPVATRAAFTG